MGDAGCTRALSFVAVSIFSKQALFKEHPLFSKQLLRSSFR